MYPDATVYSEMGESGHNHWNFDDPRNACSWLMLPYRGEWISRGALLLSMKLLDKRNDTARMVRAMARAMRIR